MDPEKQTHVSLGNILTAIGVGLAFLVAPEIAPEAAVAVAIGETAANVAARALVTGLQQAPTVAQAIWPAGTENVRGNIPNTYSKREVRSADSL